MLAVSKGAVVSVASSEFIDNYAAAFGGAISLEGASLAVKASQFVNNTAAQYGGAIAQTAGPKDSVTIAGSTFAGNAAGCQGGSLFLYNLDSLAVTDTVFVNSSTALDPTTTTGAAPNGPCIALLGCPFTHGEPGLVDSHITQSRGREQMV